MQDMLTASTHPAGPGMVRRRNRAELCVLSPAAASQREAVVQICGILTS